MEGSSDKHASLVQNLITFGQSFIVLSPVFTNLENSLACFQNRLNFEIKLIF
jgi:hypothetical protein